MTRTSNAATHMRLVDPEVAQWTAPSRTSACTGNCRQGRACDCVPDVEPPPERDGHSSAMWAGVLIVGCAVSMLVGVGLLARSFARSRGWL